jgi:hypothetical protein
MFINFTNHPSKNWSAEQTAAANNFGKILDILFPNVDPNGDEDYIKTLANECVSQIVTHRPSVVLCQGEMTLAFAVASTLTSEFGLTVLAACSERIVTEVTGSNEVTSKCTQFRFTRFRKYLI